MGIRQHRCGKWLCWTFTWQLFIFFFIISTVSESAYDPDAGIHSLQNYVLSPNDNFVLKQQSNADGIKFAVMILQKPLDRELKPHLSLKLIAVDGGAPQRSGTVNIEITVLDANDNPPVFNQSLYTATVTENAAIGTYITTVNASDADSGSNGLVTYTFSNVQGKSGEKFKIDSFSGKITVADNIDYEKDKKYEIRVIAKDQGGNSDVCKVIIEVLDTNDNPPAINIMSTSSSITEDVKPGTVLTMMNIQDPDSNENGKVQCSLNENIHFTITSTSNNFFTLNFGSPVVIPLHRKLCSFPSIRSVAWSHYRKYLQT
uniref:Cadherin domain-containing protein n=1 Tax=Lates calcarifer TaxID=8187 RepID=A0A4W6E9K8_LATCA